jgi:D-alanine-D-alanine ligase
MYQYTKVLDTIKLLPDQVKYNIHVAVVMGGLSEEREVSISSGQGIVKYLQQAGYATITAIDMGNDIADILFKLKPGVVFNALHGGYGENGCLPGILEIMKIPYTHSGVLASAVGIDKIKSRDVFVANGIKCAPGKIITKGGDIKGDPMPRPYVIKPIDQGSSIGISVVFEGDNFDIRDYDFGFGDNVLVEKYIPGRELQVVVLNGRALGVMEMRVKGRFYDYAAKYTEGLAEHIYPAEIPEHKYKQAMELAVAAHNVLGCSGVSRAEFRYDDTDGGDGELYMLEVNTHPGMTPLSIVPDIAAREGITYDKLLQILIDEALERHNKKTHSK